MCRSMRACTCTCMYMYMHFTSASSMWSHVSLPVLRAAVKLIACFSEELTLNAIKLIGKVLHHSSQK